MGAVPTHHRRFYKFKKVSESLLNRLVIIVIISYLDSAIMVACIVKIKIKAIYHSGGVKLTKIGHSVKRMVNILEFSNDFG